MQNWNCQIEISPCLIFLMFSNFEADATIVVQIFNGDTMIIWQAFVATVKEKISYYDDKLETLIFNANLHFFNANLAVK